VVVINKLDREEVRATERDIKTAFAQDGISPLFISAKTGEGTTELVRQCWEILEQERGKENEVNEQKVPLFRPEPDRRRFDIVPEADGAFRVNGPQIEAFVEMMDLDDTAAMDEVYRWLGRRGVAAALKNAGLEDGNTIRVGHHEWQWQV
jgi:GTP-binding protein